MCLTFDTNVTFNNYFWYPDWMINIIRLQKTLQSYMLCDKTDGPEPEFTNRLLKLQVVISTNRFSFTFKPVKRGRPMTLPQNANSWQDQVAILAICLNIPSQNIENKHPCETFRLWVVNLNVTNHSEQFSLKFNESRLEYCTYSWINAVHIFEIKNVNQC